MVRTLRAANGTGRFGEVNILEKSLGSSFSDLKESSCEPTEQKVMHFQRNIVLLKMHEISPVHTGNYPSR